MYFIFPKVFALYIYFFFVDSCDFGANLYVNTSLWQVLGITLVLIFTIDSVVRGSNVCGYSNDTS